MEHMTEVIIALLALIGTIAGSYMANNKTQALLNYRMDEMEKKIDKEETKTETVKEDVTILKRDVKTAFNRIDEIRSEVKEIKKEK